MKKILIMALAILAFSCGPEKDDHLVVVKTDMGEIKFVLFDETPLHKENFIKLAEAGKYNGTIFHRVIDGFMIQGGDVNAKKGEKGTVDYTLPAEIQEKVTGKFLHTRGAVAAPRANDDENPERRSNGSQFYIVDGTKYEKYYLDANWENLSAGFKKMMEDSVNTAYNYFADSINQIIENGGRDIAMYKYIYKNRQLVADVMGLDVSSPYSAEQIEAYTTVGGSYQLDGGYTVFGRVVEGFEVIDEIARVKTKRQRPEENVFMQVKLIPMNKVEITEKYGIEFPQTTAKTP